MVISISPILPKVPEPQHTAPSPAGIDDHKSSRTPGLPTSDPSQSRVFVPDGSISSRPVSAALSPLSLVG